MQLAGKHVLWLNFLAASLLVFPTLALGQTSAVKPLITKPVNENNLTVLKGNTYPLARPEYDRGPAPASLPLNRMMLVLKRSPGQETALAKLLDQQQEKDSSDYHKWLTPAQFGRQFGLSDQDIQTIVAWLQSQGFQVDGVGNGRGVIEFSGTAAELQQTFHTAIHQYVVKGKARWANASDPAIPTALVPAVAGIVSLNNFPRKPMHRVAGIFRRSKTTGKVIAVQPTYNSICGGGVICYALGPYDFATIYNVLPLWNAGIDGAGETIAIVGQSDIDPQDVNDFRSKFGLPAAKLQVIHNGPDPGLLSITGDETESDLDVEWSGAVAKGATIDFVVSETTETTAGVDLSAEYIVDHDLAPVMSESYGACELDLGTAGNQYYDQLWQQAAAEGITALVSSGDGGSALCDQGEIGAEYGLAVNGLSSTPYNVAVGGTDFNDGLDPTTYWNSTNDPTTQASAIGYIPETTWNDTCTNAELAQFLSTASTDAETNCNDTSLTSQYPFLLQVIGGSGGASDCITSSGSALPSCGVGYAKPSWQTGNGVPKDGLRDVPDVSLFAGDGFNRNFYIVCEADAQSGQPCSSGNDYFLGVGGTSAGAPSFAGIMAMANQKTGTRQGDANYVLYPLAAKAGASCNSSGSSLASSCIFYDVTAGTIAMPCLTTSTDCKTSTAGDTYGVLSGYDTTPGYDRATGLGSVNAANLVNGWSSVTFRASTTTLQLNGGSAVSVTHGTAVSVAISVSPTSPVPTGDVSLIATEGTDTTDAGTFTLSNGVASGSTTLLPGGTSYSVKAHYAGNGTYGASDSSPVTVTVTPEASKTFANLVTLDANGNLTSFSASSATYGTGFPLLRLDVGDSTATYSSSTGISSTCSSHLVTCPTGTITITNNGSPLDGGSLPLNVDGFAEDQSLLAGTYAVAASYPGDASYGSSTGSANFTIARASTAASASFTTIPVQYGNPAQLSAELTTTSNGIAPSGTFSFSLDGSQLAVTNLYFYGNPYDPSTSPPYAYAIGGAYATFLTMGSHALTVKYSDDGNYAPTTSAGTAFTVTQALPFFGGMSVNPASVKANQQVTIGAVMEGSESGVAPTGTITFYNGSTALSGTVTYTATDATASAGSSLEAKMPYTPTTAGTYDITAKYSGDTHYLAATSYPVPLTVIGPDFALGTPGNLGINIANPGASGTVTVTVTSQLGFTGNVSLSVACPSGVEITCSISPASVDLTSSATSASATLNINTTAPNMLPPAGKPTGLGWPGNGLEVTFVAIFGLAMMLLGVWRLRPQCRLCPALALLALASALALASCGGGGSSQSSTPPPPSNPGTPSGSYTVNVTGTSGNLNHTMNVDVIVQ